MEKFEIDLASLEKLSNPHKNIALIRVIFEQMRKLKLRRPDIVIQYGPTLMKSKGAIGDEIYTIYEQVAVAAFDCYTRDKELAEKCLRLLDAKFPSSTRVKRLLAMKDEAEGRYAQAMAKYDEMLEENPANALVMKRKISILKAQGKIPEAIRELNNYLQIFQADASAWMELGEIYLSISHYLGGAFCFEEVLLSDPMNYHIHCRLGEIYYTIGGSKAFLAARKHFSAAVNITRRAPRALFGLAQTAHALAALTATTKDGTAGAGAGMGAGASDGASSGFSYKEKAGAGVGAAALRADAEMNAALMELAHEELEKMYTKKRNQNAVSSDVFKATMELFADQQSVQDAASNA